MKEKIHSYQGVINEEISYLLYYYKNQLGELILSDSDTLVNDAYLKCDDIPPIELDDFGAFIRFSQFKNMESVKCFYISESNLHYCTIEGVLFDKTRNKLLKYPPKKETTSYIIPDFVSSINDDAFDGCLNLKSIFLPDKFKFWIQLGGCENLLQILVSDTHPTYSTIDGVLFDKRKTMLIRFPRGREGNYTIPEGIVSIYDLGGDKLTSITIPESVTSIRDIYAPNLEQFIVSPSNSKYSTVDGFLVSKDEQQLILYPKAAKKPYTIPETNNTIQSHVLGHYNGYLSILIPNHIEYIDEEAFQGQHLISITLGRNIKRIKYHAFYLGYWNCLRNRPVNLDWKLPYSCKFKSPLKEVHCRASIPPLLVEAFDKSSKERAILYVPKGSLQAYKNAIEWCEFATIIEE